LIEETEFVEIMKELGMNMSKEMARMTITGLIDRNGDGKVDLPEFISWYGSLEKKQAK
jgi:Ca2+-binding EF-hand superfamily protein